MSGPVDTADAPVDDAADAPAAPCVEIGDSRESRVGAVPVRRALPRRHRRTVGPWCFADHMGPVQVTEKHGLDIGPHPHTGLHTVTWLIAGDVLHRDSLGTEQLIRPGQLNLMTAGRGVSHSEEATSSYRGTLHGVQLWVAQPQGTRFGEPAFAHHPVLPRTELDASTLTVLAGSFAGITSPARQDSPLVGVDAVVRPGISVWPLRADFEHGLVVLSGEVAIDGRPVSTDRFAYLGLGRDELVLDVVEPARVLLLGGVPFGEPILMWWNFVARTREEITGAYAQWKAEDGRFGEVHS
ncbi:MAG TPA: pirin family protein, partial [Mycobacteriales bacterium]|nr:pirin family protein [Mycobacteriales bacterium]